MVTTRKLQPPAPHSASRVLQGLVVFFGMSTQNSVSFVHLLLRRIKWGLVVLLHLGYAALTFLVEKGKNQ